MSNKFQPLKKFSQNFLTNPYFQQKIVEALQINKDDIVIEIGPGLGALTRFVIDLKPAEFHIIEIDDRLASILEGEFGSRINLISGNVLDFNFNSLFNRNKRKIKILGNLPYHITSPIIFKLIDHYQIIDKAVIMTQKEVAKRIISIPGVKDYGILSVTSQSYANVELLFEVSRGNFNPAPDVDSAILRYSYFNKLHGVDDAILFRRVIRHTFNYRRKMLRNSLGRIFDKRIVYSLPSRLLEQRPEELSVEEFKSLANELERLIGQPHD